MSPDNLLSIASLWHQEGRSLALATVIETWGSAPRGCGSMLLIDSAGNFEGSVSGGCVEGSVISEAIEILESGTGSKVLEFGVADETAWEVGLSCGGNIRVNVTPISEQGIDIKILDTLVHSHQSRSPVVLLTNLQTGEVVIHDSNASHPLSDQITNYIRLGRSGCLDHSGTEYFIHTHVPSPRLVMAGAVHIAQHLYPMAQSCGFETLIVDPRTAFASPDRFSGTRLLADWPENVWSELSLDSFTAFTALSHDPKIDDLALLKALESDCFYIGALGSAKTHTKRLERLKDLGLSDTLCQNISSPIGLDISASSPSEIAVSILAEIIQRHRGGIIQ